MIKEVIIELIQTITYKADMRRELGGGNSGELEVVNAIRSIYHVPLEPGESESWDIAFEIPALPPSELEHCNKIDIEYSMQV